MGGSSTKRQHRQLVGAFVLTSIVSCGHVEKTSEASDFDEAESAPEIAPAGVGANEKSSAGGSEGLIIVNPPFEASGGSPGGCGELPLEFLDPPCSGEDLVVAGECLRFRSRRFSLPLEESLSAEGQRLQLLLLSPNAPLGQGGLGGRPAEHPLQVWLSPADGGSVDGDFFELSVPGTGVYAQVFPGDPEHVPYLLILDGDVQGWVVARVALVSDEEVLAERRILFMPSATCAG